ncbi:MAG: helix-turn-helix domain-containing protein [Armatimonadetes bacterium]|nr:helix-turn-helix domain-containing protein [Armatimonadota bacterium]
MIGVKVMPARAESGDALSIRAIRQRLGLSQADFAQLLGFSVRTIQSVEQGWRKPSAALRRMALLFLITHLQGPRLAKICCWEERSCPPELRENCVAYRCGQGHLCWFLTGTLCGGRRCRSWAQKEKLCLACPVFHHLLAEQ